MSQPTSKPKKVDPDRPSATRTMAEQIAHAEQIEREAHERRYGALRS